jgi:hypothetical protein
MAIIGGEESLGVFLILILVFCPYGAVFMTGCVTQGVAIGLGRWMPFQGG